MQVSTGVVAHDAGTCRRIDASPLFLMGTPGEATLQCPDTLPLRCRKRADFLLVSLTASCETEAGLAVRVVRCSER